MKIILPVVFFVIFLLLYVIFHNLTEAHGPDLSHVLSDDRRADLAVAAGLQLQRCGVGWDIALLGIAVETVVMVVYLLESLDRRIALDRPLTETDIHEAAIEGAVQRLRSKLMTVCAVLARPDSNPMGASAPT